MVLVVSKWEQWKLQINKCWKNVPWLHSYDFDLIWNKAGWMPTQALPFLCTGRISTLYRNPLRNPTCILIIISPKTPNIPKNTLHHGVGVSPHFTLSSPRVHPISGLTQALCHPIFSLRFKLCINWMALLWNIYCKLCSAKPSKRPQLSSKKLLIKFRCWDMDRPVPKPRRRKPESGGGSDSKSLDRSLSRGSRHSSRQSVTDSPRSYQQPNELNHSRAQTQR